MSGKRGTTALAASLVGGQSSGTTRAGLADWPDQSLPAPTRTRMCPPAIKETADTDDLLIKRPLGGRFRVGWWLLAGHIE